MPDTLLNAELPRSFTFSKSSLQDYADCPRRFQLRYIERLPWPAVNEEPILVNEKRQQQGMLFHRMVQQQLIGIPSEKLACPQKWPELEHWWQNFLAFSALPCSARNVEVILSSNIGDYRILAKYDLVVVDGENNVTIFDWKTSLKRPKNNWLSARMQTKVYLSLLVRSGAVLNSGKKILPEQASMVYWFAEFPSAQACIFYNKGQYEQDWNNLSEMVTEISSCRHFPLCDQDKTCSFCTYRSFCGRGEKAGNSEEELLEQEDTEINFDTVEEIEF